MRAWEVRAVRIADLAGYYDYAIICGGFTDPTQKPSDRVYLTQPVDRLMHPLQLYRLGKIGKFVPSGGISIIDTAVKDTEAGLAAKVLGYCNVPADKILAEDKAVNTHQNALLTEKLINLDWKKPGKPKVLLVTSGFHMRRARACFRKTNLQVTVFPADPRTHPIKMLGIFRVFPSAEVLYNWQFLIHEIIGYLIYYVMGYC